MNRKLLIVVGIGLLGAVASTYLFYHLLSSNLATKAESANQELSIVAAARDLPRGTKLTINDLTVSPWKGQELPAGSFQDSKALVGQTLRRDLRFSEPVSLSAIVSEDAAWLASAIPPGMRGVTVHVNEFAGVTQHLQVGDRVDVLVADGPLTQGNRDLRLRTMLQNVEVLTTGREREGEEQRNPIAAVTLLVEAEQSEKLNLADQSGSIRLALRNPLDDTTETTTGGRLSDLMTGRDQAASRDRRQEMGTASATASQSGAVATKTNGATKPSSGAPANSGSGAPGTPGGESSPRAPLTTAQNNQ
jgi:pilus assembly protein CpaB